MAVAKSMLYQSAVQDGNERQYSLSFGESSHARANFLNYPGSVLPNNKGIFFQEHAIGPGELA